MGEIAADVGDGAVLLHCVAGHARPRQLHRRVSLAAWSVPGQSGRYHFRGAGVDLRVGVFSVGYTKGVSWRLSCA